MKLNERAGIRDYANFLYCLKVEEISKEIVKKTVQDLHLFFDDSISYTKYSYTDLNLSWLKQLDIYINNKSKYFDAAAMTDDIAILHGLFIKTNEFIELASIYIENDYSEDLLPILYHEIMHIYDYFINDIIWLEDEYKFFELNNSYDINNYTFSTDVKQIRNNDIFNIIVECMYYTNHSESHAFMENINFEIYKYLNNGNPKFYSTNDLFKRSSKTLYGILILQYLINEIKKLDYKRKESIYTEHKKDFKEAYYNFNNLNNILTYISKKLNKIVSHSKLLFNYYYNLGSVAKQLFEMSDDAKKIRKVSYNPFNHKRHF